MRARATRWMVALGGVSALCGCVSLDPLREKNYDQVTMDTLEAAASSQESAVISGVEGLVETRLTTPETVALDVFLEAVVCLREQGGERAFNLLKRCAQSDVSDEARCVALDALWSLDNVRAASILEEAATSDSSALVREYARDLATTSSS